MNTIEPAPFAARATGGARLRLYVAEITEAWVLDQDADVSRRGGR